MNAPEIHRIHLAETASTNSYAREFPLNSGVMLITTDYQTAGRGQRGNAWESAPEKNLLFSLAIKPNNISASQQFAICELISVALCDVLAKYCTDIRIKWPNDIYHRNHKLCGILIEHDLEGMHLSRTIIGVGLNVNQASFTSHAPNPISLFQILGHEVEREALLEAITARFFELYQQYASAILDRTALHQRYISLLYRLNIPSTYRDSRSAFTATLRNVELDGRLILEDQQGTLRSYLFKEIAYII